MIVNWNEDAQTENEREVGGRYGEETGNGNNSEIWMSGICSKDSNE